MSFAFFFHRIIHSFILLVFLSRGNCSNHALLGVTVQTMLFQVPEVWSAHSSASDYWFTTLQTVPPFTREILQCLTKGNPRQIYKRTSLTTNVCCYNYWAWKTSLWLLFQATWAANQNFWGVLMVHVNNDHTSYSEKGFIHKTCYIASTVRFKDRKQMRSGGGGSHLSIKL